MIPILYDSNEMQFTSNGLGRLIDCLTCSVPEERNGIFECDFTYPTTGRLFEKIQLGRIITATHDETGEIEPFDIVSYSKPIDGIVSFRCVHVSYRLRKAVTYAENVSSLATALGNLTVYPFTWHTDMTSSAYMAGFDGIPKTIRSLIGGTEGSLLDTYGGELAWKKFDIYLNASRGQKRDFAIRYGVNMTDYKDETDFSESFNACRPYWIKDDTIVIGNEVLSGAAGYNGRTEVVPLDLSNAFETEPTTAQLEAEALAYMTTRRTFNPLQNITVDFVRLQDLGFEDLGDLMKCNLCDTLDVIFPAYGMRGTYKVVRTVWNVLADRYEEMELGSLKTTLSEALGITNTSQTLTSGGGVTPADYVTEEGTSGSWYYRKWSSGLQEAWFSGSITFSAASSTINGWNRSVQNVSLPLTFADDAAVQVTGAYTGKIYTTGGVKTSGTQFEAQMLSGAAIGAATYNGWNVYVIGNARS